MEKDAWQHNYRALRAAVDRLDSDISKHQESDLLKGVLDVPAQHNHSSIFKRVTDARQQLTEIKGLVSGEGHATAAFIAALSDRITSFTQHLNSIKQQQRSDYGSLLQQEQQLLEELAVLELTLLDEQQLQPAPAHADCWHSPAGLHAGSATLSTAQGRTSCSSQHGTLHMQDNGTGADAAADCVCRSPDRQQDSRSSSRSPAKQPLHGPSTTSMHTNAVVPSPGSSSSLPPEVQAYDAFIARHGATGGWHPDDHKAFMEVLKAHRGDYNTALASAVDVLPLQTKQSVIAHCRWHADLCELDMRKRIALVNWRTAKDAAKAAFHAQALALGDVDSSGISAPDGLGPSSAPADQQQKEVRQRKQQLLDDWKREQQAAKQAAAAAAREQRRLQEQQQRQQRQQRQEELRQRLQEAKAAKQQQQQAAAAAAALQVQHITSGPDPAAKERLQQRNAAALERQRQLLSAKKEKQAAKERAQQQLLAAAQGMRPQVEHDPNRLLSTTTAAAARAAAAAAAAADAKEAAMQGSRGRSAGGFVLHVSHKAVPNWVAGVQGM